MKIDFTAIIKESGEKLSKRKLAQEMFEAGVFKSKESAINMIQYHQSGKAKTCDYELVEYLSKRFNKAGCEIINWQ